MNSAARTQTPSFHRRNNRARTTSKSCTRARKLQVTLYQAHPSLFLDLRPALVPVCDAFWSLIAPTVTVTPAPMTPSPPPKNSTPASPTPATASSQSAFSGLDGYGRDESGSNTPPRPPFSPITPVASRAQPAAIDPADRVVPPGASFISQPPSVPLQEDENTDVLALRAAISILQVQRDKSKRDMITLEQMKKAAVADPDTFLQGVMARRASAAAESQLPGLLGPTLADAVADLVTHKPGETRTDGAKRTDGNEAQQESSSSPSPPLDASSSEQPLMPQPQNIYRCPPINWAKYHVVGESLDKLHAEQLQRPTPGEPQLDYLGRAPPYVMAAPYSPWSDKPAETHQAQTRKRSKKPVSR